MLTWSVSPESQPRWSFCSPWWRCPCSIAGSYWTSRPLRSPPPPPWWPLPCPPPAWLRCACAFTSLRPYCCSGIFSTLACFRKPTHDDTSEHVHHLCWQDAKNDIIVDSCIMSRHDLWPISLGVFWVCFHWVRACGGSGLWLPTSWCIYFHWNFIFVRNKAICLLILFTVMHLDFKF